MHSAGGETGVNREQLLLAGVFAWFAAIPLAAAAYSYVPLGAADVAVIAASFIAAAFSLIALAVYWWSRS